MMKGSVCLGCRTYFEEGEKVPLLGIFNEFRNYELPIKDNKHRWSLLKTLTGFLNSKGGTIYIGIEQKQGEVIGVQLSRKQQDEFLLFIKDFVEKIKPNVDLVNRQEIMIIYVPVVSSKVFKGKYVIKIIVRQGDPARTYHFAQKIELQVKNRIEEYEIYHAFNQSSMGGIVEIKGEALLEQIGRKAATPNDIASTFHKFCNPDPLKLDGPMTKIGFSGILREQLRTKLEQIFHNNLQSFDIEYELTYDIENQVLLIELQNEEQFKQINKFMKEKLPVFNRKEFNFEEKGEYLDFYLYQNVRGRSVSKDRDEGDRTEIAEILQYGLKGGLGDKKVQSPHKEEENNDAWQYVVGSQQQLPHPNAKGYQFVSTREICESILTKQPVLTITHINSDKKEALYNFLSGLLSQKYRVSFTKYLHTFQLSFQSIGQVLEYNELLKKQGERFSEFGVRSNLVVGINMKTIRINNYDRNKRKQLKLYIRGKLKSDVEEVEFKKSNSKFFLECRFKTRELTCIWLEQLLSDLSIKQFVIPGAEMGKASKMRIYIYCLCG